jgi:2-methylcitrate dehydratase
LSIYRIDWLCNCKIIKKNTISIYHQLRGLALMTSGTTTSGTSVSGITSSNLKETLAHQLAQYAYDLKFEDIPAEVIHEAKKRVIDALGCALGAWHSDPAKITRTVAQSVSPQANGSTVLGTHHQTTPDLASFTNGTMIRYLDFNDTYLSKEPAHPSDNISAALAVGEAEKRSGKDILTAIVLGYEIQCRLCDAASIRSRGWDHVTYGSFSTSLLAGKLYGLSPEQLVHAQGLAGVPNNAMRQTRVGELSHWKGCAFANAARNGVFAANLAKHGLTGASEVFEGEMGFMNQVSGPFQLAPLGGKGKEFMFMKTYVKHFPAEYHSQSAIEAALELRPQIGDMSQVESITIESFDAAVEIIAGFAEHWKPKSRETADHSMPYCVSAALMDGDINLDTFTQERINDPVLLELVQKVKVNRNDEMTRGYPDGIPNLLIVKLKDGREFSKKVTYPLGHAKNQMNDADIEKKFRWLAERIFPKAHVDKLLESLWALDKATDADIRKLMALFEVKAS